MAMDLRDYFRLRVSELLVMEREIWLLTNAMAQECQAPALREMLTRHSDPTRQRISNLEQVADRLGGVIGPQEHPITQAMIRTHRQFMETNPPAPLIDIQHALTSEEVAHWEEAIYNGLLMLARLLGEYEIVPLLEQNLLNEEHLRAKDEGMLPTLISDLSAQLRRAA